MKRVMLPKQQGVLAERVEWQSVHIHCSDRSMVCKICMYPLLRYHWAILSRTFDDDAGRALYVTIVQNKSLLRRRGH